MQCVYLLTQEPPTSHHAMACSPIPLFSTKHLSIGYRISNIVYETEASQIDRLPRWSPLEPSPNVRRQRWILTTPKRTPRSGARCRCGSRSMLRPEGVRLTGLGTLRISITYAAAASGSTPSTKEAGEP